MALNLESIRVIGFDLDQTLYPKSPEIDEAIQAYLYEVISRQLQIDLAEAERRFKELYQEGRGLSGSRTLLRLGLENGGAYVQEALEKADIARFLEPDERTLALLEELRKYFVVDLITGSNLRNTERKLGALALPPELFDNIITSDDDSKSSGQAYVRWMTTHWTLEPDQFLYIGDRVSTDHIIPSQMGIQTVLVNISETDPQLDCVQLSQLHLIGDLVLKNI